MMNRSAIEAERNISDRWKRLDGGVIEWDVAGDSRVPHRDHVEMSGRLVSVIVGYGVDENREIILSRKVVWPTLRTIPNNTHASLRQDYGSELMPLLKVNGEPVLTEKPQRIRFDGLLTIDSHTERGLAVSRTIFPATESGAAMERCVLRNNTSQAMIVEISPLKSTQYKRGTYGIYAVEASHDAPAQALLQPGESIAYGMTIYGRKILEAPTQLDAEEEEAKRRAFIRRIHRSLRLETPEPILNTAFDFAKGRAAESIFKTKGGLMHGPGGGSYYAAVWTNDQAEYAGPFFPFLGDEGGIEASINCYRLYMPFMGPEYTPIPSSIIAEGIDIWEGAKDRGDAAMYAYGASRFALAYGDRRTAEELWPAIEWCLEYCKLQTTADGVIASDSDELEGRFPTGAANLSTSVLTYGGLQSAANLAVSLGREDKAEEYDRRAAELRQAIEAYFGADVEGFATYRYYEGNEVLRSWICLPLTMGITERKEGTIDALFSPRLWTEDGLATQAGDTTFWDRSTLYGLRGVFAAGETQKALSYFIAYSRRRLLGDHVPYAVEAYPEGNQRHLSAESALYCRVITEGLFGIIPTGLTSFACVPRLPEGWDRMALRAVKAFGTHFDIVVERKGENLHVTVEDAEGTQVYTCPDGTGVEVTFTAG